MKEYIINKTNENQRLDKYLKRIMPSASNAFLYKMLRKKNIELNSKRAKGDEILKSQDSIKIYFSDETFQKMSGESIKIDKQYYLDAFNTLKGIEIIFEYEDFMIVYKPEGVLSQKENNNSYSLNEWCIGYLFSKNFINEESFKEFKPSVLNRLDRNTKGLVFFGKTLNGSKRLSDMIQKREIKKYYIAKTNGNCNLSGTYKAFLHKDEKNNKVTVYEDEKSVPSDIKCSKIITKVNVLESDDSCSYLEIELITGKSHQIRAHLSKLGFPLCNDAKYGGRMDKNKRFQNLTAYKIVFPQIPEGDEWYSLSEKIIKIQVDKD